MDEFEFIIKHAYQEPGPERRLYDSLAVIGFPEDFKEGALELGAYLIQAPLLEVWGSHEYPINEGLEEVFIAAGVDPGLVASVLGYGSEFGMFQVRMFGDGGVLSVSLRDAFVPFCVFCDEVLLGVYTAVGFNELLNSDEWCEGLEDYTDVQLAAMSLFGKWREFALRMIDGYLYMASGDAPVVDLFSFAIEAWGDCLEDEMWSTAPDFQNVAWAFSVLSDVGLFSGPVGSAVLHGDSAIELCILIGEGERASKIREILSV